MSRIVEPETGTFDVTAIRRDFPILDQKVHGKPLVYFDNAATTQKPKQVIQSLVDYYNLDNANVHRGVHMLSERATAAYEGARTKLRRFVNAREDAEILLVRGTTEAINLVARTFGDAFIGRDDEILVSAIEHHSNIVPWQMLCERVGAKLRVIPANRRGELILDDYEKLLNERTKLVAVGHVSNALGTINPVKQMIEMAHRRGVRVLVDGAQGVPHLTVDVQELDCDFYAFSGHKMYGPTGIGVLYGKRAILDDMPPFMGGGDMILSVDFEKTTYNTLPYKFEAGTPDIAGAIGLGAAVDYLTSIGLDQIAAYEQELLDYATEKLSEIEQLRIIGTAAQKASVISFVLRNVHPHDVGTIIDREGIAIRTGHHCAQPLMKFFQVPATARASITFYNTREEVDILAAGVRKVIEVFG